MLDHIAAALVLVAVLLVLNRILGPHASQWHTVTTSWRGRMWSLGMQATEALALGLGLFPLVGGLASLWIPERRHDPSWRAFAAFTAAAIVTVWTYTAVKAAYLSTVFATRVEERNLIYLAPLLLVGTVVWLCSHRRWLPGTLAAWAFTTWLVLYYGYQLDYPYFEAPGYGIATLANRSWHWDQPTIRIGLAVASGVLLARPARHPGAARARAGTNGDHRARSGGGGDVDARRRDHERERIGQRLQGLRRRARKPLDWVDRATGRAPTTFIGQNISSGDALGIDMLEFWNRSLKNIWSLDGSAPGPGGTLTPDLANRDGKLTSDPGFDYALTTNDVDLVGPVVARRPGLTLRRIVHHPWALRQSVYGVSNDGWISAPEATGAATGRFAYFGPERTPGTLTVVVGRKGFCSSTAPRTHVVVRVGPVALDQQRAPVVAHAQRTVRFVLPNCSQKAISLTVTPPVAVQVTASPTFSPLDYGHGDNRHLGGAGRLRVQAEALTAPRAVSAAGASRDACARSGRCRAQCQSVRRVSQRLSVSALCSCADDRRRDVPALPAGEHRAVRRGRCPRRRDGSPRRSRRAPRASCGAAAGSRRASSRPRPARSGGDSSRWKWCRCGTTWRSGVRRTIVPATVGKRRRDGCERPVGEDHARAGDAAARVLVHERAERGDRARLGHGVGVRDHDELGRRARRRRG